MALSQNCPPPNAMFYGEQGTSFHIHAGNFTQHNHPLSEHRCSAADDGFKHLQDHVATAAFDSADQVDAPKCHPNTREAVKKDIMDWILQTVTRTQWMLWLNGAAGAGKSAIARSIVALCLERNIPIARFFFFRTDSRRNTLHPVVATLVYQLTQQLPHLLAIIVPKIESDPLIFTKSFETQLRDLVFEPLRQLHRERLLDIVVLMFDGVDECNGDENQIHLIHLIAAFLNGRDLPIIAFFGSRAEHQLQQVFRSHDISPSLHQLALDDHYLPDADILLFLNDKFRQIKQTHLFSGYLGKDWPDPAHVKEIVGKSSGQFIYAAVVIKFVSSSRHHPAEQLEIIRGIRPVGNSTPFAQLDALYRHIFSQVNDIERTSLVLAWTIFGGHDNCAKCPITGVTHNEIPILLVDLASVLTVHPIWGIEFLHASLPDFLLDQTRSRKYYLDKRLWCTQISILILQKMSKSDDDDSGWIPLYQEFLPYSESTATLRDRLLDINLKSMYSCKYSLTRYVLSTIHTMDFGDGGELYQALLKRTVQFIMEPPFVLGLTDKHIEYLGEMHDISGLVAEIYNKNTLGGGSSRPNLTFQPIKYTSKSISRTTVEAGTSMKARGLAKKKRRRAV